MTPGRTTRSTSWCPRSTSTASGNATATRPPACAPSARRRAAPSTRARSASSTRSPTPCPRTRTSCATCASRATGSAGSTASTPRAGCSTRWAGARSASPSRRRSAPPWRAPDPTLSISGDGGFLFACGELATMAQEQLPFTAVIVDDGGYGMLRYDQVLAGDETYGVDLRDAGLRGARAQLRHRRGDRRGARRQLRRGARPPRRRPGAERARGQARRRSRRRRRRRPTGTASASRIASIRKSNSPGPEGAVPLARCPGPRC